MTLSADLPTKHSTYFFPYSFSRQIYIFFFKMNEKNKYSFDIMNFHNLIKSTVLLHYWWPLKNNISASIPPYLDAENGKNSETSSVCDGDDLVNGTSVLLLSNPVTVWTYKLIIVLFPSGKVALFHFVVFFFLPF